MSVSGGFTQALFTGETRTVEYVVGDDSPRTSDSLTGRILEEIEEITGHEYPRVRERMREASRKDREVIRRVLEHELRYAQQGHEVDLERSLEIINQGVKSGIR